MWIGDDDGSGGAVGRLPTVATLDTGDVLVAWIGSEGHVHGKLYATAPAGGAAAPDYAAVNEALADLTPPLLVARAMALPGMPAASRSGTWVGQLRAGLAGCRRRRCHVEWLGLFVAGR